MDSSSIQLANSQVSGFTSTADQLRIHFSRAIIIKTMTGSQERTLWWQAGDLVLDGPTLEAELPEGELTCERGDIDENIYTYRDMIPIPLDSRGAIRCELHWLGDAPPLVVTAEAIRLEMEGTPKYQKHLRDGD
jgi:hypothetical protein